MLVLAISGLVLEVVLFAPGKNAGLLFTVTTATVISASLFAIRVLRYQTEAAISLASSDELSGLPNRRFFMARLKSELERREIRWVPALFILDLDRFKVVNDTLGHAAGDQLLQAVAQSLQNTLRGKGLLARLGGDEFALLARVSGEKQARGLADRILRALDLPVSIGGQKIWPNASVGIALGGQGRLSPGDLMKRADVALYQAKARGRGRHYLFEANSTLPPVGRLSLESDLRMAIANRQLEMYYQPILDLRTMRVSTLEALLRWNHPSLGLLTPPHFMALADDTGVSASIASWVTTQVCEQARGWQEIFQLGVQVNINLSALQFRDNAFIPDLKAILAKTGASRDIVNFEVAEALLAEDGIDTAGNLEALRRLGFKVAIDDFGVGFSSLSYLRRFNVDILKIDQSFVQDTDTEKSLAIVSSVVHLAHILGMSTVAEGVETAEQLERMQAAGCDAAQGLLIAGPMRAGPVTEMIAAGRFRDVGRWLQNSGQGAQPRPSHATERTPVPLLRA